jgi:hypothetical protein
LSAVIRVTNAETEITAERVRDLLRDQHPDLADRPGTVLAVPQVRVFARWMSYSRAASIEMQVTGVAGIGGNHRNVAIREGTIHAYNHRGPS